MLRTVPRGCDLGNTYRRRVRAGVSTAYGDLGRPPLRAGALRHALVTGGLWTDVQVLASTASTNAVAAQAARTGAAEGLVVVAEAQTAGRGRLDRAWVSPPRAGLTVSVLLRPQVADTGQWGWLPLLTGTAVVTALHAQAGLPAAQLKWPNDVVVGGAKLGGILAEVPVPGAVVVGLGLNVTTSRAELPADRPATSLAIEGATTTDRDTVLRAVLRALAAAYDGWHLDPDGTRADYRAACGTLGRQVRVELPSGDLVDGTATDVDDTGALVIAGRALSAGDVVHLRDA